MNTICGPFSEDYEYREACQPSQHGPGWTIHAILFRERGEVVQFQKSHVPPGQTYSTSFTDSQVIRIREIVYLMRRRIDKTIEEMTAETERLNKALTDAANDRQADKIRFDNQLQVSESNAKMAKDNAVILLEMNSQLTAKQKDYDQTKEELAKVREYLGKERFDQIISISTLEKMAGGKQ